MIKGRIAMYCQTCGAINREDAKFCFKCGDKLERGIDPNNVVDNPKNSSNADIESKELEYIVKVRRNGMGNNQAHTVRVNKGIKEKINAVKSVTGLAFDYEVIDYLLGFHRRHATPGQLESYSIYDKKFKADKDDE